MACAALRVALLVEGFVASVLVLVVTSRVVAEEVDPKPRAWGMYRASARRFRTNRTAVQDIGTYWCGEEGDEEEEEEEAKMLWGDRNCEKRKNCW